MEKSSPIYVLNVQSLPLEDISILLEQEKERFSRFRKEEDKALFLGGRLLIHHFVGKGPILLQENGKPFLKEESSFSLTHSFPYVALVQGACPIGIDLEAIERLKTTPVSRYFPEEDRKEFEDVGLLWCLKEAAYKCDGTGYFNPKERVIRTGENSFLYRNKRLFFKQFVLNGFLIVVVSEAPNNYEIQLLDPKELLKH